MDKQEALNKMRSGLKASHRYFSNNEYLYFNDYDRSIRTKEGYNFDQGWFERMSEKWQTGWFIVK